MTHRSKRSLPSLPSDTVDLINRLAAAERAVAESLGEAAEAVVDSRGHAHLLREAQASLQESERRFRTLIEKSTDVIALLSAEGTIVYDSPAVTRILGYLPAELVGASVFDYFHPDDRDRAVTTLRAVLEAERTAVEARFRFRHRDGSYRWLEGTGTNLLEDPAVKAVLLNYRDVTDRVNAHTALAASEARFRGILHGVQAGVVVHAADDLRVLAFNARALELLGVTEAQMLRRSPGDPSWQRVQPDGSPFPDHELPYRRAMKTGAPVRNVTIGIKRPGAEDTIWLAADANPVADADGQITEVIVTFMDVTIRVRAEQDIRNAAAFTQDVLNSLLAHVVVLDERGVIIAVNEAWRRFARANGAGTLDYMGWNYLAVCEQGPGPGPLAAAAGIRAVMTGAEKQFSLQYPCHAPDAERWFRMRVSPLSGARRGVVVSHHDITETVRSFEAARASESRFKAIFEQAAVGVARTDVASGRFVQVNQRYCDILGRSAAEMEQLDFATVTHLEDLPVSTQRIRQLRSGEAREATWEKRFLRKDGVVVWASVTVSAMWAPGDRPDFFIEIVQDITERKLLEEQFRQAQKMEAVGQLSGGVAHDFNNLLTVIKGHIGLLETGPELPTGVAESLGEISVAADRAANLTRQLLMFSRRQVMQPRTLDLHAAAKEMVKMLRRMVGEQVTIKVEPCEGPVLFRGDDGMIDQILLNLVINARDAMDAGGEVTILTDLVSLSGEKARRHPSARPGQFARLVVKDTGTGIPPDILPRIFEPFFTTKQVGQGTGLGLATVYGIVQQHDGWIEVQSEPGLGAEFTIYFPAVMEGAASAVPPLLLAPTDQGTESILVVEDEPAVRLTVELLLMRQGYRVRSAATGFEALEAWHDRRGEFDVLLTDMVMPDNFTGRKLAERFLAEKPALRVIYMSGYSPEFAGKDFPLSEGENFLSKPFSSEKLLLALRATLKKRGNPAFSPYSNHSR